MAASRASARCFKRFSQQPWRTTRSTSTKHTYSKAQRRGYASDGEGGSHSHKPSSDLPWAVASIGITVPATWYLLQPQIERYTKPKADHGSHGHDDHKEEKPEEPAGDEDKTTGEDKPETEEAASEGTTAETKAEDGKGGEDKAEESSDSSEGASDGESEESKSEGDSSSDESKSS